MSRYTCLDPRDGPFGPRRCSRCVGCLRLRSEYWSQRARLEAMHASRSWFVTLTYAGELAPGYDAVQRWIKVIRKAADLRYLAVAEVGDLGRSHYHVLLHSEHKRRQLDAKWAHGFAHVRLAKSVSAVGSYAAKYVTKGSGRFRASQSYGYKHSREFLKTDPVASAVLDAFPGSCPSEVRSHKSSVRLFGKVATALVDFRTVPTSPPITSRYRHLTPSEVASFDAIMDECEGGRWGGPLRPAQLWLSDNRGVPFDGD